MIEIFYTLFGIIFLSTLLWFFLCHRMQRILAVKHPEVYEKMGKPTLFLNNSIQNGRLFNKFLFKRQWKELGDSELDDLGSKMLVYIFIHSSLFIALIAGNFLGWYKP